MANKTKTIKLTKEEKLALLEQLLAELVNNIEMKESLKLIVLQIIDEIYKGDNGITPTQPVSEKKKWWKYVLNVAPAVLGFIFRFFAKGKKA